jgi:dTDP-4-dehydrorhamnose reductase
VRIAVSGSTGRLGSALTNVLAGEAELHVLAWDRQMLDLDRPSAILPLVARERPDLVVHAAAWTDVDGCTREPELAMRRNGETTGALAAACVDVGVSLIVVSTNEVFSGTRLDGCGYLPTDPTDPPNAYGRSKLAGELAAQREFSTRTAPTGRTMLGIVRTAWLFGSGRPDFPARIAGAARQAAVEGRPLRVVSDEIGTPTYVPDLADAIGRLASDGFEGIHHVVNAGTASRAEWARDVLARLEIDVEIEEISLDEYARPSRPPRWGVLASSDLPGAALRPWRDAMHERAEAMIGSEA